VTFPGKFDEKYELKGEIGHGGFGCVYKVIERTTSGTFAAKYLENTASNREEIHLQASINDDHIIKVHEIIESETVLVMVMEYCEGGNLLEWIKRNRRHDLLNEKVIMQMLMEICEAVDICHHQKIIHRDLKPENVLLDARRNVKIGDFGVARRLNRSSIAKTFCGTPPYMAPELFLSYFSNPSGFGTKSLGYDNKCDVWSIGCILYDMANSKNRFVYHLQSSLGYDVARSQTDSISEKDISDLIDTDIPQDYVLTKKLLHKMLIKSPKDRIQLVDVLRDNDIIQFLKNPTDGHWSDLL
jgi:NIMA (never in mitosis gene a)-related kinase